MPDKIYYIDIVKIRRVRNVSAICKNSIEYKMQKLPGKMTYFFLKFMVEYNADRSNSNGEKGGVSCNIF